MTYKGYGLSKTSMGNLAGVHPVLVAVVKRAISYQIIDFSVIEGVRTLEKQKEYLKSGVTKTLNSKHLIQPDGYGWAVDLYPHPIDMAKIRKNDAREMSRFGMLAGVMLKTAQEVGCEIRWGGDWDGDGEVLDHTFFDAPHFELVKVLH